jgi:hypothetical protein
MKWNKEIERELLAYYCKESFWQFVRHAFGVARNPRGHWLTEKVHKPWCDMLELQARRWFRQRAKKEQGRFKIMFVVPRGFGKTVVVSKAFPLWCHLHDQDLATVIDSESNSKAESFLSSIKILLEGGDPYALFTWLYGTWDDDNRKWRDTEFTHACRRQMALTESSFTRASVETGATGTHPDMLVLDDPISQERIRDQGNWIDLAVQHANALIPALRTDSFFLMVGTPYTNSDVINTLLDQDGYCVSYGMDVPEALAKQRDDGLWTLYFMQARGEDGESTLPEAWTTQELDDYEAKKPLDFASQMMCTPGTGEHMPITQEQMDRMWVKKQDLPSHMQYTIHMDTAFKDKKRTIGGDESVILVFGHDLNNTGDVYFIEGYGSNRWKTADFSDKLVEIVQRYRSQLKRIRLMTDEVLLAERGQGSLWEDHLISCFAKAGMYMPKLQFLSRAGKSKDVRIIEAAGYWVDGHMRLVKDAPGVNQLVRQMLQIRVSPHDDWADAAADVFHPLVYHPMRYSEEEEESEPWGPFDDYLKTGRVTDKSATAMYDEAVEEEEETWLPTMTS